MKTLTVTYISYDVPNQLWEIHLEDADGNEYYYTSEGDENGMSFVVAGDAVKKESYMKKKK